MEQFARMDGENRILGIRIVWMEDEHADLSWLEDSERYSDVENAEERKRYEREDAERIAAYRAGDWHMKGCWAQAQVVVGGVIQTIKSGGLWGIESDSDDEFMREIEETERESLLGILESLGFDVKELPAA